MEYNCDNNYNYNYNNNNVNGDYRGIVDDDDGDDSDTIINLQFSPDRMSDKTGQLIADLIKQEEDREKDELALYHKTNRTNTIAACPDTNTTITTNPPPASNNGYQRRIPSVTFTTTTNNNNNRDLSSVSTFSASSKSSSILSMRPSSMSQASIDKILESFIDINENELLEYDNKENETGGGGGRVAAMIKEDKKGEGEAQNNNKRRCRYSISRDTLNLFDDPFNDYDDNDDDDGDYNNKNIVVKPVDVVSNETIESLYATPVDEKKEIIAKIHKDALAAEFDKLSVDEKGTIMFELHGFDQQQQQQQQLGHNNTDDDIIARKNYCEEQGYIQRFDEALKMKLALNTNTLSTLVPDVDVDLLPGGGQQQQQEEEQRFPIHESDKDPEAFLDAQRLYPHYVNSNEFRLRFARPWAIQQDKLAAAATTTTTNNTNTNNNDPNDVTVRRQQQGERTGIILHFYVKKQLFGNDDYEDDIIGRDIRLSDLTDDDREALNSGSYQIMPHRDLGGRLVAVYARKMEKCKHASNMQRAYFYQSTILDKDLETVRSGMVFINHYGGSVTSIKDKRCNTLEKMKFQLQANDAFFGPPLKAIHLCYSNLCLKPAITAIIVHWCSKNERVRTREHYSMDHDELCFKLETFGIPIDKTIFLPNGYLGLQWHHKWIRSQQFIEEEEEEKNRTMMQMMRGSEGGGGSYNDDVNDNTNTTNDYVNNNTTSTNNVVIIPTKFDVLFGVGGSGSDSNSTSGSIGGCDGDGDRKNRINHHHREHIGNLRWGILIEENYEKYYKNIANNSNNEFEKIVEFVLESGGRFLKKDPKGWQEVEHEQVIEKVSSYFHNLYSNEVLSSSSPVIIIDDEEPNNSTSTSSTAINSSRIYKEPTNVDVLCGRGGKSNHHPGNDSYREKVETIQKEYKLCTNKDEKKHIVEAVIKDIESCGGNFLQKETKKQTQNNKRGNGGGNGNGSSWYVVDHSVAFQKVYQALRDNKDPENRRQKRERYLAKQNKEKNK